MDKSPEILVSKWILWQFYESSSSDSESADENFNSVLIKKLNVNKGNAFGVKKKLSQFDEIESLSVHYERDLKESVEAQIKLDAIKYATPFVCSSRVRNC